MSLREDILDYPVVTEAVNAFGTTVHVREMGGSELISFQKWLTTGPEEQDRDGVEIMVHLLLRTLCDGDGIRQFNDDEFDCLINKSIQDLRAVYAVAQDMNSVTPRDVEQAQGN